MAVKRKYKLNELKNSYPSRRFDDSTYIGEGIMQEIKQGILSCDCIFQSV